MKTQCINSGLLRLLPVAVCLLPVPVAATPTTAATSMTTAAPTTAVAVAGSWQPSAIAPGRVSARQQVVLRLPFAARITALTVEPGARVAAGTELARFDAPLLRQYLASWKQALLEVRLAQKQLQIIRENESQHVSTRQQRVVAQQVLAKAQGKAQLQWETLAASLDLLHIKIDKKILAKQLKKDDPSLIIQQLGSLKAPFAGIVTQRRVTLGEQIGADSPVFELEALQQIYVDVGVPQAALSFWQSGKTYAYSPATQSASAHTTTATEILQPSGGEALYDASTGLWLLRFTGNNPGLSLRDGSWLKVKHVAAPEAVVWVPTSAVVSRQRKAWCIVVHKQQIKSVAITAGEAVAGRVPVLTGLKAGDRVVTQGAYELLYRDLKQLIQFVD